MSSTNTLEEFQGADSPLFKIGQLNENESKELCRKLFDKVIDLKDEDQKHRRAYDEIKVTGLVARTFIERLPPSPNSKTKRKQSVSCNLAYRRYPWTTTDV